MDGRGNIASRSLTGGTRLLEYTLAVCVFLGSFALWVVAPFGNPTSSGMLTLHCPPGEVHALATFLRRQGATMVSVNELEYVFASDNPLYARLEAGLAG